MKPILICFACVGMALSAPLQAVAAGCGAPPGVTAQAELTPGAGQVAQAELTPGAGQVAQAELTLGAGQVAPKVVARVQRNLPPFGGEDWTLPVTADAKAAGPQITAPSAVLMEASTGQVIYEKDPDTQRSPASITKIMTLILIFDAIDAGDISLSDQVVTSAHAKSMGGSQVFLEEGEVQTVETLIKCIVVASGNDASVAMAEFIAGSEEEFVRRMNERAAGLGMNHTHFEDCCGLTESPTHVTTARDVAVMSRELITKYPQIHNYATIWMENITHVTKQGTKEFGLSNTNKLLKMPANFQVTGLKTGSTSLAKYCVSATAQKDGVRLIAVVMAAPDYKARFSDAQVLLNYGYANCKLFEDTEMPALPMMTVTGGKASQVPISYAGGFSYLSLGGEDFSAIEKKLQIPESLEAPVQEGDQVGVLRYELNGKALGEVGIFACQTVEKAGYFDYLKNAWDAWKLGGVGIKGA